MFSPILFNLVNRFTCADLYTNFRLGQTNRGKIYEFIKNKENCLGDVFLP